MQPTRMTFPRGPWRAEGALVFDGNESVGEANDTVEWPANRIARMFAAAPDLLAAGSEIIRLHDTYTGDARDDDAISLSMDDLRAALRRARGEG